MPKNSFQDIVKVKTRPTRQIRPETPVTKNYIEDFEEVAEKPKYLLWIVAGISILFFLFALSFLFSKVVITITPKTKSVVLNENLSAVKDANDVEDTLPFNLMVISGEENQVIPTTETKDVSNHSKGVVVLYNAFSSLPQNLKIDTRLEGSNGKIYKTTKALTVPGMKGGTPGSVEVGIYGTDAGVEYDSSPLDFKIFGFKGTPKYEKFFARSKGNISGGFVGKSPDVSDEKKASILSTMKTALEAKLYKKANDQIPDGFVLFKDGVSLSLDNSNIDLSSAKDNALPVKLSGTLYGLLFNVDKLTKKIATDTLDGYDGADVYIQNLKDLTFTLNNKDTTPFTSLQNISFSISGPTQVVWKVDTDKLMSDILGKSKNDFNKILLQYPNVDTAQLSMRPFWKMSFPDNVKDVNLIVNYPK